MLTTIDKQLSSHRSGLSFAKVIETLLDPFVAVATLFGVAALHQQALGAPYVILALIVFSLSFPGTFYLHDRFRRMVRKTVVNWLLIALLLLLFGHASGYLDFYPHQVIYVWLGATPLAVLTTNTLARWLIPGILAMDGNSRTAVIAGCNDIGARLAGSFSDDRFLGVRFVGYFDDRARERLDGIGNAALLGKLDDVANYVRQHHVDHIYLALPMATQPRILRVLDDLKDTTASIFFAPDIFVTDLIQGRVDHVDGVPVVAVCETPFSGFDGVIKRLSDVVLATLILILILPLMLVIALGVKLTSPGPVIFRQRLASLIKSLEPAISTC